MPLHRTIIAGVSVLAAVSLFPAPAQAAPTGRADVSSSTRIQFSATSGKTNVLTVTISGPHGDLRRQGRDQGR